MLYLLDANVLIDANRDYYPLERVPEFWDWLVHLGDQGEAKIPLEVHEEIKDGNDVLATWAKDTSVKTAILFAEEVEVALVSTAIDEGYAPDLTDDEIEKIGRDPFLIAYCLADLGQRSVVTTEISRPTRIRANRHLPDVCADFGVPCCNTFQFVRDLDFSTSWRAG